VASRMTSGYIAISMAGVAGAVAWPSGIGPGHGVSAGAGAEAAEPLLLARGPAAVADGLADGVGGVADGGAEAPLVGVV
jgi:hypothetical protein